MKHKSINGLKFKFMDLCPISTKEVDVPICWPKIQLDQFHSREDHKKCQIPKCESYEFLGAT